MTTAAAVDLTWRQLSEVRCTTKWTKSTDANRVYNELQPAIVELAEGWKSYCRNRQAQDAEDGDAEDGDADDSCALLNWPHRQLAKLVTPAPALASVFAPTPTPAGAPASDDDTPTSPPAVGGVKRRFCPRDANSGAVALALRTAVDAFVNAGFKNNAARRRAIGAALKATTPAPGIACLHAAFKGAANAFETGTWRQAVFARQLLAEAAEPFLPRDSRSRVVMDDSVFQGLRKLTCAIQKHVKEGAKARERRLCASRRVL